MPRFLDPNNPALNTLVKAKKVVNARNKKKFEGQDPQIQTAVAGEELFQGLSNRLTQINAYMLEIGQTLSITRGSLQAVGARTAEHVVGVITDRFVTATGNILKTAKESRMFFKARLNNSLNKFNGDQVADIGSTVSQIRDKEQTIQTIIRAIGTSQANRVTSQRLAGLFNEFAIELAPLLTELESALENYRQVTVPAGNPLLQAAMGVPQPPVGAGRGKKVGGAVALRLGMDTGSTFATANRHPPRNREDLIRPSLPYRFL